jgi:hypothetical protein
MYEALSYSCMYKTLCYWLQGVLEGKHMGNRSKAL